MSDEGPHSEDSFEEPTLKHLLKEARQVAGTEKARADVAESDLDRATLLLNNALSLRMYGDISHLPMTQREWDTACEEFLRRNDAEHS